MKLFELIELDSNPENIFLHANDVSEICSILDEKTWFYHTLRKDVTGYKVERKDAIGRLLTTYLVTSQDVQSGFITYVQK